MGDKITNYEHEFFFMISADLVIFNNRKQYRSNSYSTAWYAYTCPYKSLVRNVFAGFFGLRRWRFAGCRRILSDTNYGSDTTPNPRIWRSKTTCRCTNSRSLRLRFVRQSKWKRPRLWNTFRGTDDNQHPGPNERFVSLCPTFDLCYRYISIDNDSIRTDLVNIMSSLSMMQHPTYFRMSDHIQNSKHLFPLLGDVNLTEFMLTTLPTCGEIFGRCRWHGQTIPCCEAFSLQRTEEGFCYSFNSLTSEAGSHWWGADQDTIVFFKYVC